MVSVERSDHALSHSLSTSNNNIMAPIAGPGHWNDPDMLQIGNPGLSDTEARAHFSAWCIVAAPLLIGADIVSGLDNATLSILGAPELIAVDQDPLGVQVGSTRNGRASCCCNGG